MGQVREGVKRGARKKLKKVNPVLDSAKMDAKCPLQTMCAGRAEKAGGIYLY